jgi:hypothetical protein
MDILEDESFDEDVIVVIMTAIIVGTTPTIVIVAWTCAF